MIHQLQCLEMQPYIVALRFCHLTGNVNQTAWYVNWFLMLIEFIRLNDYEIIKSNY